MGFGSSEISLLKPVADQVAMGEKRCHGRRRGGCLLHRAMYRAENGGRDLGQMFVPVSNAIAETVLGGKVNVAAQGVLGHAGGPGDALDAILSPLASQNVENICHALLLARHATLLSYDRKEA